MVHWNRMMVAGLAAALLMGSWGVAEVALEPEAAEVIEGVEVEIAPGDGLDVETAMDDALALDGLEIDGVDPELSGALEGAEDAGAVEANAPSYVGDFAIDKNGVLVEYKGESSTVIIPDRVKKIGDKVFYRCKTMTSVRIPDGVTSIGAHAFDGCSKLASLDIPDGVTRIGEYAFRNCDRLIDVVIPEGVARIEEGLFEGCGRLERVIMPDSVKRIGKRAFRECEHLKSVVIPEGVTKIGAEAFRDCDNLTSVNIPSGVTTIESGTFFGCEDMIDPVLPDSLTWIEDSAFKGCEQMDKVTIPASVTDIEYDAFVGTTLKSVRMLCRKADLDKGCFDRVKCFYIAKDSSFVEEARKNKYNHVVMDRWLGHEFYRVAPGQSFRLKAYDGGKKAANVTWSSFNPRVATVKDGVVTGIKVGRSSIIAKFADGKQIICEVFVREPAAISKPALNLAVKQARKLYVSGLAGRKVTWSSDNPAVATVKNGRVTAKSAGTCTVTAQVKGGAKLTCKVTVAAP